jgi:hypothetical protein
VVPESDKAMLYACKGRIAVGGVKLELEGGWMALRNSALKDCRDHMQASGQLVSVHRMNMTAGSFAVRTVRKHLNSFGCQHVLVRLKRHGLKSLRASIGGDNDTCYTCLCREIFIHTLLTVILASGFLRSRGRSSDGSIRVRWCIIYRMVHGLRSLKTRSESWEPILNAIEGVFGVKNDIAIASVCLGVVRVVSGSLGSGECSSKSSERVRKRILRTEQGGCSFHRTHDVDQ